MSDAITDMLENERDRMWRNDRREKVGKVIYTLGYSRTTEREFRIRTWEIYEEIDAQLKLIDIRRLDSRSRNGKWCYQGKHVDGLTPDYGMEITAMLCGWLDILSLPELANDFGGTKAGLEGYKEWLSTQIEDPYSLEAEAIGKLVTDAKRAMLMKTMQEYVLVLLCSEKSYKGCHRVPLADILVEVLGEGWTTVHL